MIYFEIVIAGKHRGPSSIFTYSYDSHLAVGTVVTVLLRGKKANGFIVKISSKPSYKTLEISAVYPHIIPTSSVKSFLDLSSVYPLSSAYLASLFMPAELKYQSADLPDNEVSELPILSPHQTAAFDSIITEPKSCILYGDTGSGKMRLYMHLVRQVVRSGKNVIVLTPEIGLSAQLYTDLRQYFGNIVIYHSDLTPKQKRLAWSKCQESKSGLVLVGPRSALGMPLANIGLIIVDESHDQSYRQDNLPYVNAKVFAAILAKNNQSRCIYGSATPLITDIYQAKSQNLPIVRLTELAVKSSKSHNIQVLDYADPGQRVSGGSLLKSSKIALETTFQNAGQALILSNRRGTARYVSCADCGYEERCSNCDHLLVYHHDKHMLHCHFCATKYPAHSVCPSCGGSSLSMRSQGTKAIVEEIKSLFGEVEVKRFDTDSAKAESLSAYTSELRSGEIDCIIGTQMVAKGLDLPMLKTLVVIGSGSQMSGFMSEEREYQLLYQVLGRAIRGHQDTDIFVQTSAPDSATLKFAVERDYDSFYIREISARKKYHYPPFCFMLVVHFCRKSSKSAEQSGKKIASEISKFASTQDTNLEVGPPTPNSSERLNDNYNWHVLVKSPTRSALVRLVEVLGPAVVCELDPLDLP
jgi:primosomal protein N' (replication factor Y) (superfamily II helicase)